MKKNYGIYNRLLVDLIAYNFQSEQDAISGKWLIGNIEFQLGEFNWERKSKLTFEERAEIG